ncbi:MAG: type II toxin-antitoxin system VapC family toxin [Planctomycetes bacterium]|nr:type II toxin-antitoxin system VapC family toxin [Planctomycetota bacterium]
MIVWDTSALVRCFQSREPGHARATGILRQRVRHAASTLLGVETASALVRFYRQDKARLRETLDDFDAVAKALYWCEMDESVLRRARSAVERHRLRGSDAIHLATTLHLAATAGRRGMFLAATDGELVRAAKAEGIRVLCPDSD